MRNCELDTTFTNPSTSGNQKSSSQVHNLEPTRTAYLSNPKGLMMFSLKTLGVYARPTTNKLKLDTKLEQPRVKSNLNQLHGTSLIPRARVKTIKMTLLIVSAYLISWSPFLIINTLFVYGLIEEDAIWQSIRTLSQTFAHLNSAVNPIIYWIFNCDCRIK